MAEVAMTIDRTTGTFLVAGPDRLPPEVRETLEALIGPAQAIACAAPIDVRKLVPASGEEVAQTGCIRIAGYWHDGLIEGPGRRTVVKLQGCPLRCHGCITPETWSSDGGFLVPVERLVDVLLDPAVGRDGITILGGEPFFQPEALLALVGALRSRGCEHILCYSGYTYEALRLRAEGEPAIGAVLDEIDMLIDGPYVASLADGADPWTGSANQRVLTLKSAGRRGLSTGTED
jgi:anaerobic ribonucleoside-triphosphate reductase activating protein